MEFHDPNGKIECEVCGTLGRPEGGVLYSKKLSAVHIRFELPNGWALSPKDGSLTCVTCSKPPKIQTDNE